MSASIVVDAVVLGSIYLLFASGFTLVYGSFRILNLAHGAVMTLGAYFGLTVTNDLGLPLWLAAIVAAVSAGLANVFLDAVVVQPIVRRTSSLQSTTGEELAPVIVTLAFGAVITGLVRNVVTGETHVYDGVGGIANSFEVGGVVLSQLGLMIIAAAVVLPVGIFFLINRTRVGTRIRAVAEDRYMAAGLGVRPSVVSATVFFISGALAGLTGVAAGLLYSSVNPTMGDHLLLLGFVIVTVGGLGSLGGTIIAALLVAFVQSVASNHYDVPVVNICLFGMLLLTLLIRPSGILGSRALTSGVTRV